VRTASSAFPIYSRDACPGSRNPTGGSRPPHAREWSCRKRNLAHHLDGRPSTGASKTPAAHGALAGKFAARVVEAGVVLLVEPDAANRVETAIHESGGQVLPMTIDRQGVQVAPAKVLATMQAR